LDRQGCLSYAQKRKGLTVVQHQPALRLGATKIALRVPYFLKRITSLTGDRRKDAKDEKRIP
jgi:hypothetical protein